MVSSIVIPADLNHSSRETFFFLEKKLKRMRNEQVKHGSMGTYSETEQVSTFMGDEGSFVLKGVGSLLIEEGPGSSDSESLLHSGEVSRRLVSTHGPWYFDGEYLSPGDRRLWSFLGDMDVRSEHVPETGNL